MRLLAAGQPSDSECVSQEDFVGAAGKAAGSTQSLVLTFGDIAREHGSPRRYRCADATLALM